MTGACRVERRLPLLAAAAGATVLVLVACDAQDRPAAAPTADRPSTPTAPFRDATREVGLDFVHVNGMSGELYLCEMMGPGGALFDYDGDGDLDVFIVQGGPLGAPESPGEADLVDRLYRNDLELAADGTPRLRFSDVTAESGIRSTGYGMGVTAGDYDNDGNVDLYVTNFGANRLYRNQGDGTFRDVTAESGSAEKRWSVSAAFLDYDRDGWLDLFIGNYLDMTLAGNKECFFARRDYCNPKAYAPIPDRLLRNRGDGTFEDVTGRSRIARNYGAALGVAVADFDLDGWLDLYVANDGLPNQCWMNRRDGTFEDTALLGGAALSADGMAEASMGVDAGDYDNDGDEDLFMSHLATETNTLYVNDGSGQFEDRTIALGLAAPSRTFTGFGTSWLDFDNDGWLDLLVVNGAVQLLEEQVLAGDPFPLHQRNQLFRNESGRRFEEVVPAAGGPFSLSEVSRGAAFGDLDNDGDIDVLQLNNNGVARMLLNEAGGREHWIGLRLTVGSPPRDALGAWVELSAGGGPSRFRRVRTAASYASSSDPRVLFGTAERDGPVSVTVRWPDGVTERLEISGIDCWHTIRRGDGETVRSETR